jgi:hypothetical protein
MKSKKGRRLKPMPELTLSGYHKSDTDSNAKTPDLDFAL